MTDREELIFVDDIERAGWFAVFAGAVNSNYSATNTADGAVRIARERQGADMQSVNAQLRAELADARAEIDRLHDTVALLEHRDTITLLEHHAGLQAADE